MKWIKADDDLKKFKKLYEEYSMDITEESIASDFAQEIMDAFDCDYMVAADYAHEAMEAGIISKEIYDMIESGLGVTRVDKQDFGRKITSLAEELNNDIKSLAKKAENLWGAGDENMVNTNEIVAKFEEALDLVADADHVVGEIIDDIGADQ